MKLTKRSVENLLPPTSGWKLHVDSELKGFGIRVYSSGNKTFCCGYHHKGSYKWITLGKFGILTVDQARIQAIKVLAAVTEGRDPQNEKKQNREKGTTFLDLIKRYRSTHAKKNKPETQRDYNYLIDHILLPKLGNKELSEISRRTIEDLSYSFKQSISKRYNTPISGARVNRLLALLSKLFNLAIQFDWIKVNPAAKIEKHKENQRERIATKQESKRLLNAIMEEKNIYYRHFFLLLWHTMARRSELQRMKWDNLDLDNGFYHMDDTKAGRPFTIPLGKATIEIIKNTPKVIGNPYVFAGKVAGKPINGFGKAWKRIREKAKVQNLWIHDIRRTGGSNMIMNGASLQDVAQLLNHSNLTTTQRYAQLAQSYKKSKMEEHENRIIEISKISMPKRNLNT